MPTLDAAALSTGAFMHPQQELNMSTVLIGGTAIGAGSAPVFWPDLDLYFKRDVRLGLDLVARLADAGCSFLKGAVLHDPDICLAGPEVAYFDHATGSTKSEPYSDVIRRHVLPLADLARMLRRGREFGLACVLSVYDREGLAFAVGEGAVALKVPSSNIVHRPLIEAVCATGLPVVIDTGRSRGDEIERAVSWVTAAGGRQRLILQHSPPGPPAPAERFHMRMIAALGERFGCPVGLSDHHSGLAMVPLAVTLGAAVIEKGVAVDAASPDIDIAHALPISKVADALALVRSSWQSLGERERPATEVPVDPARMGLVARTEIARGATLDLDNVRFAFPRLGIGVEDWHEACGRRVVRAIAVGAPIEPADLEPRP